MLVSLIIDSLKYNYVCNGECTV